jgi:DNA polymerase I-like protein with 3'-5' exonuclease and polymerase domains
MGADTGRQKCREPNMQNPPARGYFAKEVVECITTPDPKTSSLLTLDYSSLQMRLATIDSEDPELFPLYLKERDADIHSKTGYGIFVQNRAFDLNVVEVEQAGRTYKFLEDQLVKTNRGEIKAKELQEDDELL